MTIHLVYPCGDAISCPQAIGRHLRDHLARRDRVVVHDVGATYVIVPQADDVLIGHPTGEPWTVFNRSVRRAGWRRRIGIQPFCPGDARLQAFTDHVVGHCDRFLAICGSWWFARTGQSRFAHWRPKLVHLDLAVDRGDFPPVKTAFNPPGRRRFVYIGHAAWYKQPGYLCRLARMRPGTIAWIGKMRRRDRGPERLGRRDFRDPEAQREIAGFDFLLTVGNADANPTTILEAMAWGLIPVCTRESGYADMPGIVNLPADDLTSALAVLDRLQTTPESELFQWQRDNWAALDGHFTWPRFCAQVEAAIDDATSPAIDHPTLTTTLALRWHELRSPHRWLAPRPLRHLLRAHLRGKTGTWQSSDG